MIYPEAAFKVPKKTHTWERQAENWYVEPVWCSKRLFQVEEFHGSICDPAAGGGNIMIGAQEAGLPNIRGMDLMDRGNPSILTGQDFFAPGWHGAYANIVCNPPYGNRDPDSVLPGQCPRYEEEFLRLALQRSHSKVALMLHGSWINGEARSRWLEGLPLYRVYLLAPRPSCPPGEALRRGETASGGTKDYAWYVFLNGYQGSPTLHWLRRDD